jgi:hypothetical protein
MYKRSDTPGGIRTPNPQFRRLMLYPIELRVRKNWEADRKIIAPLSRFARLPCKYVSQRRLFRFRLATEFFAQRGAVNAEQCGSLGAIAAGGGKHRVEQAGFRGV